MPRDHAGQVFDARADALIDDGVERRGGIVHLAVDQLVDGVVPRREQALQEDADEPAQLLFGRLTIAGPARQLGRLAHRVDRRLHDHAVEAQLVAEVIVDGGHVGPRGDGRSREP